VEKLRAWFLGGVKEALEEEGEAKEGSAE
jgi:hypothetical protein